MKRQLNYLVIVLLAINVTSCSDESTVTATSNSSTTDTTTKMKTEKEDRISLFDGKTLAGWHAFNKTGEIKNWTIENGALVCLGAAKGDSGGDIVSDAEYENFELSWDWRIDSGGNSGVMYHVIEDAKYKAPYETGPEYQLIDDVNFDGGKLENWQKTGADYFGSTANVIRLGSGKV